MQYKVVCGISYIDVYTCTYFLLIWINFLLKRHVTSMFILYFDESLVWGINQVHSLFRASKSGTNKVILCCMIDIEIIDHIYEYFYINEPIQP